MVTMAHWRPMISYLSIKEIVETHEAQFGSGGIVDIIDVTDLDNIRSVFAENV